MTEPPGAATHAEPAERPRLTVAVAGASGLIGSALAPFLAARGHVVRSIKRTGHDFDAGAFEGADVVVNLAGAGIGDHRWTAARKALLRESRVEYTRRLVAAAKAVGARPRVWLQGSAIGVYGDRGDEVLTEASAPGPDDGSPAAFLSRLCLDWEEAGQEAEGLGARVVVLRTGLVQAAQGGVLERFLLPFKAGVGGPLGDGRAWQSWISLEDWLRAALHALDTASLVGPVNLAAPRPVTSAEYAKTLGRVLGRPAVVRAPAFALKALFGELATGGILASQRAVPAVLSASGFTFVHDELESALRAALAR